MKETLELDAPGAKLLWMLNKHHVGLFLPIDSTYKKHHDIAQNEDQIIYCKILSMWQALDRFFEILIEPMNEEFSKPGLD